MTQQYTPEYSLTESILITQTLDCSDSSYYLRYKEFEVTANYREYHTLPAMPKLVCFKTVEEACSRLMDLEREMMDTKELFAHRSQEKRFIENILVSEGKKIQYGKVIYNVCERSVCAFSASPPVRDTISDAVSIMQHDAWEEECAKTLLDPEAVELNEWFTKNQWLHRKYRTARENFHELIQELMYVGGYWVVVNNHQINTILVQVNGTEYVVLADKIDEKVVAINKNTRTIVTAEGLKDY